MDQSTMSLDQLQKYAKVVAEKEYSEDSRTSKIAYDKSLNRTLASLKSELENEVKRSKELSDVDPLWDQETDDVNLRVAQLRILTAGYHLASKNLPDVGSGLPALLAGRELNKLVSGTRDSVRATSNSLREARSHLQDDLNSLGDAETLNEIFKRRVKELRDSATRAQQDDSHTIAVRLMDSEKLQTRAYRQDRTALDHALDEFITNRLAPLLAAEELGGPVAGSVLNITDEMLAAGFTDKGKVNRGLKTNVDYRQRRIDEMFGNLDVSDNDGLEAEARVAAQAMRDLTRQLIDLSFESGRYLELEKETAASRYLVRSKVAVLDPRDGKKIRLVDFGKPLEDWL